MSAARALHALFLILILPAVAWTAAPPATLDAAQQELLRPCRRLLLDAQKLLDARQHARALALIEDSLRRERAVFGHVRPASLPTLRNLATLHQMLDDWGKSADALREIVTTLGRLHGPDDWRLVVPRVELADAVRLKGRPRTDRQRWLRADLLSQQVWPRHVQGKSAEALKLAEEALAIRTEMVGEKHPSAIVDLNYVAAMSHATGDYPRALRLGERVVALRKEVLGERHPDYAFALRNLTALYNSVGQPHRALPLIEKAAPLRRRLLGERTPEHVADLQELAATLIALGRARDALPVAERAVRLGPDVFGADHYEQASSLTRLVQALVGLDEPRRALAPCREALAIRRRRFGERHPETLSALNNLAVLHKLVGEPVKSLPLLRQLVALRREAHGKRHPFTIDSVSNLGVQLLELGEYREALPLLRQALELRREVLGEKHPQYASSLHNLANLYAEMGDHRTAQPLVRRAAEVYHEALGAKHPDHVRTVQLMATICREVGDHAQALALYRRTARLAEGHAGKLAALTGEARALVDLGRPQEALKLARDALAQLRARKDDDPGARVDTARQLADLYALLGDHRQALALLEQARAAARSAFGEKHPLYRNTVGAMIGPARDGGDHRLALRLTREALERHRAALGEKHPLVAGTLLHSATLLADVGDLAEASLQLRKALELLEPTVGTRHPTYSLALNNLATVYQLLGEYRQALAVSRRALALFRETLGAEHPLVATALVTVANQHRQLDEPGQAVALALQAVRITRRSQGEKAARLPRHLHALAVAHLHLGDRHRAIELLRQAVELEKEAHGEEHPNHASHLTDFGYLLAWAGDRRIGERLLARALEIQAKHLDNTFAALGERQRLAALERGRIYLNGYLRATLRPGADAAAAYGHVLAWKGLVTARQAEEAALRDRPELAGLAAELRSARASLARLASLPPGADHADRLARFRSLQAEKEKLEARLADHAGPGAWQRLDVAAATAALPPGGALVDFLEYSASVPPPGGRGAWRSEARIVAFVVRAGRPVVRIDLGEARPIRAAIDAWHRPLATFPPGPVDEAAGRTLRKLIWQPLAKALAGCSSVVIAPDGRLCAVPFAALPGGKPGTYLIEEMAIAHVASARQLVELRSRKQPAAKGGLLALGGADYGPAAAGVRGWSDLPATRREARRLGDIYRSAFSESRPRLLQGADASRAGLLRALAGGDRPRWLHLATHGFFRPPASTKARSASLAADLPELAVTYSPQLLSGVVLAGANRDPAANTLTAEEVGSLDLRGCELVVISACETGLGAAAGGEGLLGLQRAFHIAGSASVLASLWQVPDEATQVLMERFYDNLWSKKLPRGEALRQAQLWLLRQGPRHPEVVRGVVNPKTGTGRRTLADGSGRLHPFFWAAWVLSGDWR